MDENNNKENNEFSVNIDKEELKNQTKDTVNQVKETIKNVDFKKDADATKGFILEMISKPFTTIQNIVTEKENRFSNAVILMICFIASSLVNYLLGVMLYEFMSFKFMSCLLSIISPIIYVLAFTVSTFLFGGKDKKSITTIISGIAVSITPLIFSEILSMIYTIFVSKMDISFIGYLTSILSSTLSFIAIVLMFFAIKGVITTDDDDKTFRKVAIIICVGYLILKVLSIVNLYSVI